MIRLAPYRMRVCGNGVIAALVALVCAAPQVGAQARAQVRAQVQAGTLVRPETTTVGQHFVATVQVRVPSGTSVTFPRKPDSAAHVDSAGAFARRDSTAGGFTYSTATYVLAAWDTGTQGVGLSAVTIVEPAGTKSVPLTGFQVYVRSVLPRDTALRKPKPFRPVVSIAAFDWMPWILAAIAAALLAAVLVAWRKWCERRSRGRTPYEVARSEFARIEASRLIDAGESDRHAVDMVRVMRVYLAAVVPAALRSATTHELAVALTHESLVPAHRVITILDETDRIKFAAQRSTSDRARDIGVEARSIVDSVHSALDARASEARASEAGQAKAA